MSIELTNDTKRILLADDNEINAQIAALQLRDLGYFVETVSDGMKAVEAFRESEEYYYDAIIMDIMMPVMDGIEAITTIRGLDRADALDIPVVAVSANDYPEEHEQLIQNGVSCFVTKPYSKVKFQTVVAEQINARVADKV